MNDNVLYSTVSWIQGFGQRYLASRAQEQVLRQATDMVVEVADPRIRRIGRYRKSLRAPMKGAMGYCTRLVDSIPGPVRLSRQQYHTDPLVKAIFVSADELEEVLRLAPENSDLSDQEKKNDSIALLTMTRKERTIFKHEQQGDVILRDVKKRTVNFIDHRLVASSATLDMTKERLKDRGLEVLATIAMERISSLRGDLAELRERKEYLKAMRRMLNGRSRTQELFSQPDHETVEKLRKLEKLIEEVAGDVELIRKKIEMPEDSLALLGGVMGQPGDTLVATEQTLRLDWMNVLLSDKDGSKGNDISLTELSIKDELQRYAVLVVYSPPGE
ncbi:MAG: hypothetical protein U9R57_08975 [Thermodesulfobacteriota bacterium]|nr:hypothetical protein [Thermodesulfobacteriota bacterium]